MFRTLEPPFEPLHRACTDSHAGSHVHAKCQGRSEVGGVDGLSRPRTVTVSPDGKHLYAAGSGDNAVAVFSIAPPVTGLVSKMAFFSNRDGNYEIYVMNADGSAQTRVTNNSGDDTYPTWSPDGAKIALTTRRHGNSAIYLMNADGSGQTRLTDTAASNSDPPGRPTEQVSLSCPIVTGTTKYM